MVSCVLLLKSNSFSIDPQSSERIPFCVFCIYTLQSHRLMQTCSFENIFLTFLRIMPSYPIISASHPSFPFTLFWGIITFPSVWAITRLVASHSLQSSSHDCTEVKVAFFPIWSLDFPYFSNIINYVLKSNFSLTLTRRRVQTPC